jgi:hypothetical protein
MKKYLNELIGEPFIEIDRFLDLVRIMFGKEIIFRDERSGVEGPTREYVIHAIGKCRVLHNGKVIIASQDIYETVSADGDWDRRGNNIFDQKKKGVESLISGTRVQSIFINPSTGDLVITLDNSDTIEIFNLSSQNEEIWRFFSLRTNKPHLVMTGNVSEEQ